MLSIFSCACWDGVGFDALSFPLQNILEPALLALGGSHGNLLSAGCRSRHVWISSCPLMPLHCRWTCVSHRPRATSVLNQVLLETGKDGESPCSPSRPAATSPAASPESATHSRGQEGRREPRAHPCGGLWWDFGVRKGTPLWIVKLQLKGCKQQKRNSARLGGFTEWIQVKTVFWLSTAA